MIIKTFKLTEEEYQRLLEMMERDYETNFSNFVRKQLLSKNKTQVTQVNGENLLTVIEQTAEFVIRQHQKNLKLDNLEKIFLSLNHIEQLAESSNQVAHKHMKKVMACFRELLSEVDRELNLSEEFKEKWL